MDHKKAFMLFLVLILVIAAICLLSVKSIIGNITKETDPFSQINSSHWTHMPLTYSIDINCDNLRENIMKSLRIIENSTNRTVYFKEASNPDINISCSQIENCYEKKIERRWFWIVTTEAVCEHESGTAQITKMKGNKIINAKINLFSLSKEDNCPQTEIHEILHVFDYQHSTNNKSIMYPEKLGGCNEKIDKDIVQDLIAKYNL